MKKPILDKQDMIRWLGDIISAEMDKPEDEIDMELVMECEAYLAELMSDIEITDAQMQENIAKIKGMACHTESPAVRIRLIPRMRRIIAAVCAASILAGGGITAYAFVPAFRDMVHNVLNLGSGSSVDDGGVTFINRGETHRYQSIGELVENEGLDILYPHNLPEGLKIKTIIRTGKDNDQVYTIGFADGITTINIDFGEGDISTLSDKSEIFTNSKGITSYILAKEEMVISTTVHNGWTYYITTNTIVNIKIILENLY